jgi:hypothetical protein
VKTSQASIFSVWALELTEYSREHEIFCQQVQDAMRGMVFEAVVLEQDDTTLL